MEKIFDKILQIFLPPLCINCNKLLHQNDILCSECLLTIPIANGFYCPICNNRLPFIKKICHPQSNFVLASVSFYENPIIQNIIQQLKYNHLKQTAIIFNKLIYSYLQKYQNEWNDFLSNETLIIPVPITKLKLRQRGYNQSMIIALSLQQQIKLVLNKTIEIKEDVIKKSKENFSQTQMKNNDDRKLNVKNVFQIINPSILLNKNIIIVDDVFTTGATLNEISNLLKKNKCKKIISFTIAKA
ncbi:MAG: ComF family protein [Minisyncoccia bacterium]